MEMGIHNRKTIDIVTMDKEKVFILLIHFLKTAQKAEKVSAYAGFTLRCSRNIDRNTHFFKTLFPLSDQIRSSLLLQLFH